MIFIHDDQVMISLTFNVCNDIIKNLTARCVVYQLDPTHFKKRQLIPGESPLREGDWWGSNIFQVDMKRKFSFFHMKKIRKTGKNSADPFLTPFLVPDTSTFKEM